MKTLQKITLVLSILLATMLSACSQSPRFVAPEIDPPQDLIPEYIPDGFELVSGFKLPGDIIQASVVVGQETTRTIRLKPFELKSPLGNDILGVYYEGDEHLLLISKSEYPGGSLELFLNSYKDSSAEPCQCECLEIRLNDDLIGDRFIVLKETHTIDGTQVAIFEAPLGLTAVFVQKDELLAVESGISLEEILKIVGSLLEK
jgi:hypothetical protein